MELRLGTINLEPKDLAYVRALVRLFAHTEKLSWSFADAAPYHAVVADPGARAANPGFFAAFEGLVLTLGHLPGQSAADTVAYPIRANQFRDWLKLRQDSLRELLHRSDTPAMQPVMEIAQVVSTAAPSPALVKTSQAGRRYKLRRWPPADLLRGDSGAMRMATFMSRNALSMAQLAALTGQPEDTCASFVAVLHAANLLVEVVAAELAPETAVAEQAAPVRRGLMASLRRHLGI